MCVCLGQMLVFIRTSNLPRYIRYFLSTSFVGDCVVGGECASLHVH